MIQTSLFLAIQAIRKREYSGDFIKVYRNLGWIDSAGKALKKMKGSKIEKTANEWNEIHRKSHNNIDDANLNLGRNWHAWSEIDGSSSWDYRGFFPFNTYFPEGHFVTNYLIEFASNKDEKRYSRIPFQVGVAGDPKVLILKVDSSSEAFSTDIIFRILK